MAEKHSKPERKAKSQFKATFAKNVILHLSDLHFGYDLDKQAKAERKNALDQLISVLNHIEHEWKPTIICITGDIAMRALSSDYSEAEKWLSNLLKESSLKSDSLVICPGNHDVFRDIASAHAPPADSEKADHMLCYDNFQIHRRPFSQFSKFCTKLKIPKYSVGRKKSYLTGIRYINNVKFISLNSAWFSQRNKVDDKYIDDGKLWLGLPLLEYLESRKDFHRFEGYADSVFTILLFHHPFEILHENERNERKPRKNTQEFIAYRSHIILTGHDHGMPADPTPIFGRAFHFRGGATYKTDKYENGFHLIRLEDHYLLERRFVYEPSSSASLWLQTNEPEKLYYWDYSRRIIEDTERQKQIDTINRSLKIFEEMMLQADYEKGLTTLEDSSQLIVKLAPLLSMDEKGSIKKGYSNSILNNLPFMTFEQNSKCRAIMLRILSI